MKKMKIIIISIMALIFFTGCNIQYKVTIEKDGFVTEEISGHDIPLRQNYLDLINSPNGEVGIPDNSGYFDDFTEFFNTCSSCKLYKLESFKFKEKTYDAKMVRTYANIDEYYKNSLVYKELFLEGVAVDNSISTIDLEYNNKIENLLKKYKPFDKINVIFDIPYYVIKNNSHRTEKKDNSKIYNWQISSKNLDEGLYIKIDSSKNFNYVDFNKIVFIILGILFIIAIVILIGYNKIKTRNNI